MPVTFNVVVPLGALMMPEAFNVDATRLMLPLLTVTLKPPLGGWMALPWRVRSPPPVRVILPPSVSVPLVWSAPKVRLPCPARLPVTVKLPALVVMLEVLVGPEPSDAPDRVSDCALTTCT